jgi:hypothetical protein
MEEAMKYRTFDEIRPVAEVQTAGMASGRFIRQQRLLRLAEVLERHAGPVRLVSGIEYYSEEERRLWREDGSPLAIAFAEPEFRREGLVSDRFGDVMEFFDLTSGEAHHLFCDCHYPARVTSQMIAVRVRSVARGSILRNAFEAIACLFVPQTRTV